MLARISSGVGKIIENSGFGGGGLLGAVMDSAFRNIGVSQESLEPMARVAMEDTWHITFPGTEVGWACVF